MWIVMETKVNLQNIPMVCLVVGDGCLSGSQEGVRGEINALLS